MDLNIATTTTDLALALADVLQMVEDFSRKCQTAHWNVTGSDFTEFHSFFGMLYENAYGFVDDLAESIRRLDTFSPPQTGPLGFDQVQTDAKSLVAALFMANNDLLSMVQNVADMAGTVGEYGIQNLLGDIQFTQEKARWQLKAHLS